MQSVVQFIPKVEARAYRKLEFFYSNLSKQYVFMELLLCKGTMSSCHPGTALGLLVSANGNCNDTAYKVIPDTCNFVERNHIWVYKADVYFV